MNKIFLSMLLAAGLLCQAPAAVAAVDYKIVTASERGTYIRIGRDLAEFVAPAADIKLDVLPSAGSADNARRLRYEPGVKLALVQSDVYQSFVDLAASGNPAARTLIRPLRVILPLYNEEIHFVVRADSPRNFIHEIYNARLNAGEQGSGTALTSATLYRLMFHQAMPEASTTYLSNEEALAKLVTDKTIDVVAVVAGQPAKLFVDMKPESRKLIKLLKFDPNHASSKAVLETYFPANLRVSNYANLLTTDIPGLAVKAFLVTYEFERAETGRNLQKMARSLCRNFGVLQEKGHPKWREVDLALPKLGRGWTYYAPTTRELRSCMAAKPGLETRVKSPSGKACPQQERILGLCE
ncbi:MAG: C4-dicarboxylate ABC transporter substrate-binding protein [Polaromonas sp. 24-62-144]|jgi:TRAP transporter TAXI family solute receptor|uniref:TAXI family TRAP transporter solute-binding subunit n=1 Tax=Polaromonas sp. TaxID=1869339 RepID=UPI000BDC01CC|nr:TAXI family TRAP transporter solute-binding subunit [Polaromonas sp.]OYY51578.1 MAG: C4-dicarboxylate ABC transporter substrate-binding protein [Polaromonas sp. 35-63-240]OYY95661.1 MAG: C4-dicarboxylate ABC transporter substrate-binding protein [Polaromonas sp. 28-63-22]OYZ83035.1 MAG: C4-dicarboxylate ABC transporter substrate-binding protein [Polaromonas sp. 24-62-144]HQS33012.1 TAXI family TRAP transporter solute-binding subunit [Polaromonas sp.]HQS91916.1 TAXI family TRAP transporter s